VIIAQAPSTEIRGKKQKGVEKDWVGGGECWGPKQSSKCRREMEDVSGYINRQRDHVGFSHGV